VKAKQTNNLWSIVEGMKNGMNQVLDEEMPMQIFNLALQEQQQILFERQYVTDDNYSINITHN